MTDTGDVDGKESQELSYNDKLMFVNEIAKPIATKSIAKKIYKVVKKAAKDKKNLTTGLKQLQKSLRKNQRGIAVFAGDVTPIDIMCHLPALCEDQAIPYCYVPSKLDLGASLGGSGQRACVAVMVHEHPDYKEAFDELKEQLKFLPVPL